MTRIEPKPLRFSNLIARVSEFDPPRLTNLQVLRLGNLTVRCAFARRLMNTSAFYRACSK